MLISHPHKFTWRGHPATLYLLRNDGYAWGRIVDADGENFDVSPDGDVYDMPDTDALELLAELVANHPDMVSEATGWRMSPRPCPRCDDTGTDPKDGGDCELCGS